MPFAPHLKITLYQLDTLWYINKNNHYLMITAGTANLLVRLLVVYLGKAPNGMPPSLRGKQVVGPSSLPVVVAQFNERHANRA